MGFYPGSDVHKAQWRKASRLVRKQCLLCALPCAVLLSRVCLFVTPWTVARQAPLSMRFSRRKYWLCLVAQSCPALCDPMDYSRPGSSLYGDSPGKNTGVGCHALPQEIFPTQGSNPSLLHRRQSLYHLR